jgi:hypothetical protein
MAIKLVLCDMDGTLVPFGHDGVSDRTIRAIHELVESGIHFGPSSGRERGDLVRFFYGDELCLGTGIMGGGKMVYVDGELVYRRTLPYDALLDMVSELLLIDGGATHAATAENALMQLGMNIPVFGMVKDDRHRTRALITAAGDEIRLDKEPSVFSFVGAIQEETHRFAIGYQKNLRSKRVRYSELDDIPGIGPTRKQQLLQKFKSLTAIREASLMELEQVLPQNAAFAVYSHFQTEKEGQ